MITLPITDKDLNVIIKILEKNQNDHKDLYAKLWSFRFQRNTKKG